MRVCKETQNYCVYANKDEVGNCSLDECKFRLKIEFSQDGSFVIKPIKPKRHKKEDDNGKE